jgi:V8-like Glu-specific endopeptidase
LAKIFFSVPDGGDFTCSGSLIKRGLVLTAGHCIHSGNGTTGINRGFHKNIVAVPAYREGQAPFGQHKAINYFVQRDWVENGWMGAVNSGDFALLVLEPRQTEPIKLFAGHYTGYLGWQTNSTSSTQVLAGGFPSNLDNGERLHYVVSETGHSDSIGTTMMTSDMHSGSSGSPWIINFGRPSNGQQEKRWNRVVGVSSYGPSDGKTEYAGSSILSNRFFRMLQSACRAYPDNCSA